MVTPNLYQGNMHFKWTFHSLSQIYLFHFKHKKALQRLSNIAIDLPLSKEDQFPHIIKKQQDNSFFLFKCFITCVIWVQSTFCYHGTNFEFWRKKYTLKFNKDTKIKRTKFSTDMYKYYTKKLTNLEL
uniref:Uncharacterized protein n=1 Tax=Cacopsylla melanoneura TaxID=428564 RepID=A0A8D8WRV2_9HEMI